MNSEYETIIDNLPIKDSDRRLDVYHKYDFNQELYRMFTDELRYSPNLEIIFNKDSQCFTIKDLDKLRTNWNKTHPD